MNATHEYATTSDPSAGYAAGTGPTPLRRPAGNRMLGGVAAGLARSLGIDPVITRIAFVVLTLAGGAGVPLYLAGWLLVPDDRTGQSVAAEFVRSVSANRN